MVFLIGCRVRFGNNALIAFAQMGVSEEELEFTAGDVGVVREITPDGILVEWQNAHRIRHHSAIELVLVDRDLEGN